ncbi:hypothetical protein FS837_007012 [Tulasnella sp. UAMH 9824]|nr:hypothetical protein FS837_007012 [Tulasnella sp. UAMH 9824]
MPAKYRKPSTASKRVTRSTAGSIMTGSNIGSPPPPIQQPNLTQEPEVFYPPVPPITVNVQQSNTPPLPPVPEPASPIMSIGGMPLTPADKTVRIQSLVQSSTPPVPQPYVDPYESAPQDDLEEEDEEAESEDECDAVEQEVSRFQGGSNTSKQTASEPRDEREGVLDASRSSLPTFGIAYAKKRSHYLENVRLDRTRERRLYSIHNDIYPGADVENCWLDPVNEVTDFVHLFKLLDRFIDAKPVPDRPDHYHADRCHWANIQKELTEIYRSRKGFEPEADIPLPPAWPGNFRTEANDGKGEYAFSHLEELFILYRHLVETWLAQAWEEKPLTKEQRISKLPDEHRICWKKLLNDRSTVAEEFRVSRFYGRRDRARHI